MRVAAGFVNVVALTLTTFVVCSSARAAEPRYAHFIDNVCLNSGIDPARIATNVSLLQGRELSREFASNMPADRAWAIKDGASTVLVGYQTKMVDGQDLKGCALGFQGNGHASAIRALEAGYRLRRVIDEVQGTQRVTGYTGDLIGLSDAVVTVQSASGAPNVHIITVTKGARLPREHLGSQHPRHAPPTSQAHQYPSP